MPDQTITTTIKAETYAHLNQSWRIEAIKEGIRQADEGKFASEDRVKSTFAKWGVNA